MGAIHYGRNSCYEFGLREEEFIQHIGIFGRSGSGKTNLAYLILQGLARAGKPFLVFDWKRNYRDLTTRREFSDIIIFTVGRDIAPFRFNPLIPPPGTPATVWLKKLIEIMCHAYFLGEGVSILLLRAMDSLYRECGLYREVHTGCPTIQDVRDWLSRYKARGREGAWMESATRAVETLCFAEVGKVLNHGPFFDIPRLLSRRVVLELDALSNADKTFLIESLLLWIHHYRLAQEQRERFKHGIVIEEAHHVLLRKKQEVTGEETVTDVLLREIRELGESVICLDQHPSLISKPALGNTYTTFAMNLKHRGDIAMIQDSLLLDSEQAGYLGRLEVGWAIVRLQGRWFWPFLVKLPLVSFEKGAITDARLRQRTKERQEEFSCLLGPSRGSSRAIPAQGGVSRPQSAQDRRIQVIPAKGKKDYVEDDRRMCAIELTTQEKNLLLDIWQYPISAVTKRYSRLCISRRCGNQLQSSLLRHGLIGFAFVAVPTGRTKILTLTDKGRKALGIDPGESDRHGGPGHRYWVNAVAEHLQASGFNVTKEAPVGGGRTVDIVAERDGKRIAFEIETGKADAAANVRKCLDVGFDEIFVVATSEKARDRLGPVLPKGKTVRLVTAAELLQSWSRDTTA